MDKPAVDSIEGKKIRDFITLKPYDGVYSLEGLSQENIIQSYIFTDESTHNFTTLFQELAKEPGTERRSFILSGDRGVGKTHSLAVIREVLQHPDTGRLIQSPAIQQAIARLNRKHFVVEIHCQPSQEESLKELFYRAFAESYRKACHDELPPMEHWLELEDSDEQIRFICDFIPEGQEMLILLDDISEKLLAYRNVTRITGDLEFVLTIALATSMYPVFMVATFFDHLLNPPAFNSRYQNIHQKIVEYQLPGAFIIQHITKRNVLDLANRNIIIKTDQQRRQLLEIYNHLAKAVPYFRHDQQLFLDLYPVHPVVFQVSFYLHRYIKNFSLLPFIYSTANKILGYRCSALATIDLVFDLLYHEFKKVPELQIALQSFETIQKDTIPNLPVGQRLLARLVLKAVFLLSITEECRPTIENVIDALLLSDYQNKPVTPDDIAQILLFFEEQAPQCLRKIQQEEGLEFQLVTIDHTSLDYVIHEVLKEDANLDEKIQRLIYQKAIQVLPGMNLTRENYTQPVSSEPLTIIWRGTTRRGIAGWADRYEQLHVTPLKLRSQSLLQELADKTDTEDWCDTFPEGLPKPHGAGETGAAYGAAKVYDWQLWILSPHHEKWPLKTIRELVIQYPQLLILQPGQLTPEEIQRFAVASVLSSEEHRYRFFDMEEEYQNRLRAVDEDIRAILQKKYFADGILHYNQTSQCMADGCPEPDQLHPFLKQLLVEVYDEYFPLHPKFELVDAAEKSRSQAAEIFLRKDIDRPEGREFAEKVLLPLHLVKKAGSTYRFEPESDNFLESQFIAEVIFLIGSYPQITFPLAFFYKSFANSPYGLNQSLVDIILIALVAAGKIKIFQSNKADLDVLNRMSLSGEFDLTYFDSVQAIEEKVLPLPELLQWGYILCNTQIEATGGITQSRKHLKNLLPEWLDFERCNSLEQMLQQIPNEMVTTLLWRELQSCHRNAKAIENIVENIVNQQYNLDDGLAVLARTFSNNLKAFQSVLKEIGNIRDFLQWMPAFQETKSYILTSDKTGDQAIENLRLELSNFFERPTKLIDAGRRAYYQEKYQLFKQAYTQHYLAVHDRHLNGLTDKSELALLMKTEWWKNLPKLARVITINSYSVKSLYRMMAMLQERECDFPTAAVLERSPRCLCGFRMNSSTNVEALINRIIDTVERLKVEYQTFFSTYRKMVIRELQKISSVEDSVAREVVNCINGNLDVPISLDALKLVSFILKRKIKVVSLQSLSGEAVDRAMPRDEFIQNMSRTLKELEESRELYFMLEGEL
ncbi:MAG: hypothetical protein KBB56_11945 [Acidobacteria bacterium]|nr:hypothetical protein [Acidobacteriota bacterium]